MKLTVRDGYKTFVYNVDLEFERIDHEGDTFNKSRVEHRWTASGFTEDVLIASDTGSSLEEALAELAATLQWKLVDARLSVEAVARTKQIEDARARREAKKRKK